MNPRLLAAAGPLLIVSLALGQSNTPNLQGYVYDSHHVPIEGASATAGASGKAPAQSDNNGHFSIEILPSVRSGSPITLRVDKDGFNPWTQHLGLSEVPVIVTLIATNPKPRKVSPPPPLWPPSGETVIDSVQERLKTLNQAATDAELTDVLERLFEAPVFSYLGEELPEDALFRFCRTERVLLYYGPSFKAPAERGAAEQASQNLIYLQDIFGEIYGPVFSAKEQCDRFGAQSIGEYKAHLGRRVDQLGAAEVQKAEGVMDTMLASLHAVGLAPRPMLMTHRSPPPPPTPPEADSISRLLSDLCQRGVLWEPVDNNYERRDLIRQSVNEISAETKKLRESLSPQSENIRPLLNIETASKSLLQNSQLFASGAGPVDCTIKVAICTFRTSVAEAREKLEANVHAGQSCGRVFTCEPCSDALTPAILKSSLRRNVSSSTVTKWGKQFHEWSLWLDLPENFKDQINSVSYTFPHGYLTKDDTLDGAANRSLGLAVWPANTCTNGGDSTAHVLLKNGQPPLDFTFDLCLVPSNPSRPQ